MVWSIAVRTAMRRALLIVFPLMAGSAHAAVLDQSDTSRMAAISEAIVSLEKDVSRSLHGVPSNDAEQIEAYSYVELNLEAAQERLNSIFLLMAISIYADSSSDELQVLALMYGQVLSPSKTYLVEKKDAIASMAMSHPASEKFAAYSTRAAAILGEQAIPLIDELYRRIAALHR